MNEYICSTCGNSFSRKYYTKKVTNRYHCSRKCQNADKAFAYERCNKTRTIGIRNCEICGNEFHSSHIKQSTCSIDCRSAKKRKVLIEKIEHTIHADVCDFINSKMKEGFSQRQIAVFMKIEYRTLMGIMKQYGIKSFTRHEAVKMQWVDNPERRKRASERIRKWMDDNPEETKSNSLIGRQIQQVKKGPTNIERIMMNALDHFGLKYDFQYVVNNKFICDFRIANTNIVIECDGDYWHDNERQKKKDYSKDRYLETCGYTVLRFSETEIKADVNACVRLILEFNHQPTTLSEDSNLKRQA